MSNIEFSYIWDTIRIIIAVFAGWSISRLNDYIKNRKEINDFNKKFIDLYNAFKDNHTIKLLRLIKAIGIKDIERIFNAVGAIWYEPTRKDVSGSTSGKISERTPFKIEKEDFDIDKYLALKKESIQIEGEKEEKIRTQTYVVVENLQNLRIRIDIENYMLLLGYGGISQLHDFNNQKRYQFNNPDENKEVLVDFLKYLEKSYKANKIIKKKEILNIH